MIRNQFACRLQVADVVTGAAAISGPGSSETVSSRDMKFVRACRDTKSPQR